MKKLFFIILFAINFSFTSYAKEQIELIVPYGAGGGTDLLARRIATSILNDKFEVVVTNRTGGAANIAFNYFVNQNKAMILSLSQIIENSKYASEGYPNNITDLAKPIYFVADGPQLLYTSLNVNTLEDMIKLSESKDIVFGSNTPGTASYLIYDQFCNVLKVFKKCNQVTYRSSSTALPDLFSQRIDVYANSSSTYDVFTGSGKTKAVVTISKNRFYNLPDLPSTVEKGFDIDIITWFGLFHKGMSQNEVALVSESIQKLMTDDEHKKYGFSKITETPNVFFQKEIDNFRKTK